MPITTEHIHTTIGCYLEAHPDESGRLAPILELMRSGADLASRTEFRGHATAGAVLTDPAGRVLHIHHLALDRWLLPGGHLEAGDASLIDAALRELTEETGIDVSAVVAVGRHPVHVDVHPIPANDAKGEPAHQHVDFRFLFRTSAVVGALQTEEVTAAAWRDPSGLHDPVLRNRILPLPR